MPSERRPRRWAGLERAVVSLLGVALLIAASVANAGPLLGDTNCDGEVNEADFDALLAGLFGGESECAGLDVNGDGIISAADVVALIEILPPPAPTASPTPTLDVATATPTPVTPSVTVVASPTPTHSPSATAGSTRTATITITITPGGPTLTRTRTGTITRTPTNTRRPTRTTTASATGTISRTPTRTRTATRTRTPTNTTSPGRTIGTFTSSPTATRTGPTPTATATCGNCTATATPTRTSTPSGPTQTASRTGTRTRTPSITRTPSKTGTVTRTASNTRTTTATRTTTRSRTATNTRPPTVTRTPPATTTITLTPSVTRTRTPSRTPTATIPRPFGPQILFFGIANADNVVRTPVGETEDGKPIFDFPNNFGFIIVAEARAGTSGALPDTCGGMLTEDRGNTAQCGDGRAAIAILADRPLGNGSPAVCDMSPPNLGGVPAVPSLDFSNPQATNAINDLACRFDLHPVSSRACTLDERGNFSWVRNTVNAADRTQMQYCSARPVLNAETAFPLGLTRLKLQIKDVAGNVGNQVEIAILIH